MHLRIDARVVEAAKQRLGEGRERWARWLRDRARSTTGGRAYAESLSDLADEIIAQLAVAAMESVRAESGDAAGEAEAVALVALGGYGRRELCPRSDVDLLFLVPSSAEGGPARAFVDRVLYGLWDLGLEVGQAVRTISECAEIARAEPAVLSSMIEARLIAVPGRSVAAVEAFAELERFIDRELLSGRAADEFIQKKLEEAERRHHRYGESLYLLEPDVKHGEGGLRDLHTALWIARARWRVRSLRDLLRIGVLTPREVRAIERAYDFLLRVRAELHLAAGRRRDGLGFEFQEAIARTLGFIPEGTTEKSKIRHGTERFMRAYYFHARQNRRISRLILERASAHPPDRPAVVRVAPGGFKTFGGMLTVADRDQLERDPPALMRIFRVAQEESLEIYSYTKDLIAESLPSFDRRVRRDPQVVSDFLTLLEDPRSDGSMLILMHELGVLRRFMPELNRVAARWQHSLYHVYTVDVHSLFVLRELKRLRTGLYAQEQPELTRRIADLPRPAVLYLGGFLHDVGKGWKGGDHSIRGGKVAQAIGDRLEAAGLPRWTAEDTADMVWLVEQHLAMSDISQRRDLSDAALIERFAEECKSEERLAMLHLLTFADMKATSPKVWNDWKGMLLSELYQKAKAVLEDEGQGPSDAELHLEARRQRVVQEIVDAMTERGEAPPARELVERFVRAMPERYLLTVPPRRMRRHVEPWREVSERGGLSVHLRQLRRETMSELTVICPDRPGLLAILAGTMAANRLQILSAQIFSVDLPGGGTAALDILSLRDADGGLCDDPERWSRVREDLARVVVEGEEIERLLAQRLFGSTLSRRPKPHVETKVARARDGGNANVFDVFCQDHLGALYSIAKAFADQGMSIRLAKISTQGDRVADGFYVVDAATGMKIEDEARLARASEAIGQAIEQSISRS